jgi:hypothetical protein
VSLIILRTQKATADPRRETQPIDQPLSSQDAEETSMTLANNMTSVTGGGTGIGAAIARLLAKEGVQATITGRRQEV